MACRVGIDDPSPAPFLALTIAGRTFAALLDSGATASLFGEEVLAHLRRHSVRLRACNTAFQLASGAATSCGSARLVVRWEERVRRHRFVYLPGLSVPVIVGRDFLARTGIVIDIANKGYREGPGAPLKPFAHFPVASVAPRAPGAAPRQEEGPSDAALQAPLTSLLRKSTSWSWGPEQDDAFRALSKALVDTAELKLPDLNREFVVQADASDLGIGAVLLQEHEDVLRPVAFASRSLTPAERNYSVTERECLAIVFALRKFDHYVDGVPFVVETDHMALTWLKRLREPSGRLARWALTLQRYNFVVRYRKGSTNVVADALSRAPVSDPDTFDRHPSATTLLNEAGALVSNGTEGASSGGCAAYKPPSPGESAYLLDPVTSMGITFSRRELLEAQRKDPFCQQIADELEKEHSSERERGGNADGRKLTAGIAVGAGCDAAGIAAGTLDSYLLDADGVLLRYIPSEEAPNESFKVVIPRSLRRATLSYFHDSRLAGHASGRKTYLKLSRSATWPGMKRDVLHYSRSCRVCQTVKPRGGKPPGLMQPIDSQLPWQITACDVMGPFPRSRQGHTFLLAVTDHFTKWVELFPLRKLTARVIWDKLLEVFTRFGFPAELITDNASYFTAKVFVDVCAAFGIKHRKTTTYHPQANPTERMNRNVKPLLAAFARQHRDWDACLREIGFSLRTSVNRSTGYTPAFLNFGRELPNPMDRVLRTGSGASAVASGLSDYAVQPPAKVNAPEQCVIGKLTDAV
nr:uncharacterized protein LOC126548327 [Dermacentor andersoni]